jgi:beta-lactamase family protein
MEPGSWTTASRALRAVWVGTVATVLALALGLTVSGVAASRAAVGARIASDAAPGSALLSATATPAELTYGAGVSVTGSLSDAGEGVAGAPLALQSEEYPFHGFLTVARVSTAADGGFTFAGVAVERDSRLRVVVEGSPDLAAGQGVSPTLSVSVDPQVMLAARSLGPGRTRLSMRVRHARQGDSGAVEARWYTAMRGSRRFHLAAVTRTRELTVGATGVMEASALVEPPASRFIYRVCVNPPWERSMGAPASHRACPRGDFELPRSTLEASAYQGQARGTPLPSYPSAGSIAAASSYLDGRSGRTSFAVVDSSGRVSGLRLHEHFETASVVKVMMLTAYLQMLAAQHRGLSSSDTALLYPMIHISDNGAASAVFSRVGGDALARIAREAGMSDYAPGVGWWAYTQTSAVDQARLFFMLDRLIPQRFYGYARYLMSSIEPSQSWGIPPVARPRWEVFFKTGALPERGLFNEVGRLERGPFTFTIAVFTDGDPSMAYGEQTIEGVAANLLARTP